MKNMIFRLWIIFAFICLSAINGCRKIIEVAPPEGKLTVANVYSDSTTTLSVLMNIYTMFDEAVNSHLSRNLGMYSDEFDFTGTAPQETLEFLHSAVSPSNFENLNIWKNFYSAIYQCNDMISHLKSATAFSPVYAKRLVGEAKFIRAFSYFYLVNLYGSIPLILTTDVDQSRAAQQRSPEAIYNQIVKDLKESQNDLPADYPGSGKVRANKWVATAMLARVDLYMQDWKDAEQNASLVLGSGLYTPLESPEKVFLAGSHGTILQFWTQYGYIHDAPSLLPDGNTKPLNPLTDVLLNSFENNDLRRLSWIRPVILQSGSTTFTYYYSYKYHNRTTNASNPEYLMALRIAEQYLIRAEARAQLGNVSGGLSDLNVIRARAGLLPAIARTKEELLKAIEHERRVELFGEWGSRFFDLKRTGQLNGLMQSYKLNWRKDTATALPIPQNELSKDPRLVQNIGY